MMRTARAISRHLLGLEPTEVLAARHLDRAVERQRFLVALFVALAAVSLGAGQPQLLLALAALLEVGASSPCDVISSGLVLGSSTSSMVAMRRQKLSKTSSKIGMSSGRDVRTVRVPR